jgi:hypothetical protein
VLFKIDETLQITLLCESGLKFVAMLITAPNEVARHANVKRAITPIGHEIDEPTSHSRN